MIDHADPFIVSLNDSGRDDSRVHSVDSPVKTTTESHGFALVTPQLAPLFTEHANSSVQRNMPGDAPLLTICANVKGTLCIDCCVPGATQRSLQRHAWASPYTANDSGHHKWKPAECGDRPPVYPSQNCVGRPMDGLVPTITAGAEHHVLIEYTLAPEYQADEEPQTIRRLISSGVRK